MLNPKEKDKLVKFWSEEYKQVDSRPRYCNLATISLFDKLFLDVKNKQVLDIGCGHDLLMDYFRNRGAKITGIDLCPEVVNEMKKDGFNVIEADCCNLPMKDNTFDITFSIGVVEHFEKTKEAIKEHIRVTKKGGRVVVIIPNLISPFCFCASAFHLVTGSLLKYGKRTVDGKYFTKSQLRKMMEGCQDIKISTYSSSSLLRSVTKEYNKKLAETIENSYINKKYGLLLFAVGTKI